MSRSRMNNSEIKALKERRTPTYHEGANDERTAILAKVRRMQKVDSHSFPITIFINWLLQRNERYKKNPGGL